MGEGAELQDLEEEGQRAGCAAHYREDRLSGGSPLMYCDVKVYCEGGVLVGWRDEQGGVSSRHSNHSREDA